MFDNNGQYNQEPVENTMYYQEQRQTVTEQDVSLYLAKVMGWMCLGLLTTFVTCFFCLAYTPIFNFFWNNPTAMFGVIIAELVVVFGMSAAINKISAGTATVLFLLYAALTGVTFMSIGMLFEFYSIVYVFVLTAFVFVTMAVYGFVTKKDLTRMGSLLFFGLIGIIGASLLNMFFYSTMMDFLITVIGIVVFIGLVAYDTQKIKQIYIHAMDSGYHEDHDMVRKFAIFGALTLYLDFINLFLKLLRLFGRRRN